MNDTYFSDGKKAYPISSRKYRSKGKEYDKYHLKLSVASDYDTGKIIQHDYVGDHPEEVLDKIDDSKHLSDKELNLNGKNTSVSEIIQALVIVFTVAGLAMVKLPEFKAFLERLFPARKEA